MVQSNMLNNLNQEMIAHMPKLQPSDISDAIIYALGTPERCQVRNHSLDKNKQKHLHF